MKNCIRRFSKNKFLRPNSARKRD